MNSYLVCATSIIAVGCPLWLWVRCNRKESGGRPITSVFRCSTRTCVGNMACSTTVNLSSLTWCRETWINCRDHGSSMIVKKMSSTSLWRWSKDHWRGGGRGQSETLWSCKWSPRLVVSRDPDAPGNGLQLSVGLPGWRKGCHNLSSVGFVTE